MKIMLFLIKLDDHQIQLMIIDCHATSWVRKTMHRHRKQIIFTVLLQTLFIDIKSQLAS